MQSQPAESAAGSWSRWGQGGGHPRETWLKGACGPQPESPACPKDAEGEASGFLSAQVEIGNRLVGWQLQTP